MPPVESILIFSLAAVLLLVVPGPAVLYIVARSVDQGRLAGLVSAFGVHAGTLFHVAAAALGVSAAIASSATAFAVLKYCGAAYLIWIGVRRMLERAPAGSVEARRPRALRRLFVEGFVVNLLNPKTALFFLAFLPQFVDPAAGSPATQVLFFGGLFVVLGVASDGAYALLAGSAAEWMKSRAGVLGAERYLGGSVFVALGLFAAFAEPDAG